MSRRRRNKAKAKADPSHLESGQPPSQTARSKGSSSQDAKMPCEQLPTPGPVNGKSTTAPTLLYVPFCTDTPQEYRVYNPQLSCQRLEVLGFELGVTEEHADALMNAWFDTMKMFKNRPTLDEYKAGGHVANLGAYTYSALFTALTRDRIDLSSANEIPNDIRSVLFGTMPYGARLGELLAADGYKCLESLAAAFPPGWVVLSISMSIWDFSTQDFNGTPKGSVFLALNPEYTVRYIKRNGDVPGQSEKMAKQRVMHIIEQIHGLCGPTAPFWGPKRTATTNPVQNTRLSLMTTLYPKAIVASVRSLPHIEDLEDRINNLEPCGSLVYRPFAQTALDGLLRLLGGIQKRKDQIHILHLVKIPLLDRRMVAIILRECPNITMIGIYDCPMIHFGDVIALLDLIHEINLWRESHNLLPIESFDFFPHYNSGKPYKDGEDDPPAAYGVTWSPVNHELAQRGILRIVLEAYLKAREMKIGLLFEKRHAFRKYLSQLPLIAMTPEVFLDALVRHLELHEFSSSDPPQRIANSKRESLYDLLRQVRLGLENQTHDWPMYYSIQMAAELIFCCSCGHEMPEEFFTARARIAAPHERVCAGCALRKIMDKEEDHQKPELKETLDHLFPDWNPAGFNVDAPMPFPTSLFFRLRTKKSVRDPELGIMVNADGHLYQARYRHELVRDNKVHQDCLHRLPSLDELLGSRWAAPRNRAIYQAMMTDVNRITIQILSDIYPEWQGSLPPLKLVRVDEGKPNSDFEGQQWAQGRTVFGFETSSTIHKLEGSKGFVSEPEFW